MTGRRTRSRSGKGTLAWAAFFLYVGFSLFAVVWLRTAVVNLEYEIGKLDKLRAALMTERKMVVAERASVFSMEHVEKVANKRLGMGQADRDNMFFVKRTAAAGPHRASAVR
ncbi:MAG: hypothetical protein JSU90_11360 [Nitrospiraceae bacterium]|nr:MAG: hypothetical protein JSU90_11360 [Nitrospiraceae bacterium]